MKIQGTSTISHQYRAEKNLPIYSPAGGPQNGGGGQSEPWKKLHLLHKKNFLKKPTKNPQPPSHIVLKSGHFLEFFLFRPVHMGPWWEPDKFVLSTFHIIYVFRKNFMYPSGILKKGLKKKKNTQILRIEISTALSPPQDRC